MLTRVNVTRLVAVACISALGLLPAVPAHASTGGDGVAATTHAIDAAAQRWFAAQADAARIDATINEITHRIAAAQRSIDRTRKLATARALVIYKNSDVGFSMFGDTALDSARRAQFVDDANQSGDAAIAELTASVSNLNSERRHLEDQRSQQRKSLQEVSTERTALDTQLASVRAQARRDAAVALTAARDQIARNRAALHLRAIAAQLQANPLATPTAPAAVAASATSVIAFGPPAPADNRVSPHHDDPFLTCTRARESAGRYSVVSPSGYYGAYQFLPSTWDAAAVHAGRRDLVGVLPSLASPFDQDETAWALYQWQGPGPWGGRC